MRAAPAVEKHRTSTNGAGRSTIMQKSVGEQFARALAAKDSERMRALLADPIAVSYTHLTLPTKA